MKKNLCVISNDKITLVTADNKAEGRNVSSFLGSSKVIKLGKMENKRAIEGFENFLKRNATCNAEIVVFHENFCDEPLGIIVKQGELFVPPRLCRSSQFVPDVPDHYRYSLTENELITIELTNFSKVIHNLKMLMSGVGYSP